VVCGGVAFYCALQNLPALAGALRWVLGTLSPFLLGGAIAFILNVPMRAIEAQLPRGRRWKALRRPLALALTLAAMTGVMTLAVCVISPGVGDAVRSITSQLPAAFQRMQAQLDLQRALLDGQSDLARAMAEVMKADAASESALTRNARPITVLWALAMITWVGVAAPLLGLQAEVVKALAGVPESLWSLLTLGIGAYMAARTADKFIEARVTEARVAEAKR